MTDDSRSAGPATPRPPGPRELGGAAPVESPPLPLTQGPVGDAIEAPNTLAPRSRRDVFRLAGLGAAAAAGGMVLSSQKASAATTTTSLDWSQQSEGALVPLWSVQPTTPGFAPFQAQMNSFSNVDGTYNHGVWLGWNANLHAGGNGVPGMPGLMMGFEDWYLDSPGDMHHGMEWYVEYWSPDHTSQQMLRPFYARVDADSNQEAGCQITMDLGTDGTGQLLVKAGENISVLEVQPTGMTLFKQLYIAATTLTLSAHTGSAHFLMDSQSSPTIFMRLAGAPAWHIVAFSTTSFAITDNAGRPHMLLTQGGSPAAAVTRFSSSLKVDAGVGFWGRAAPGSQPPAPVTLADVIAVIRGCGLSA